MNIDKLKMIIESSSNISEVLRKLELKISNGNYRTIKKIISEHLIDISHFHRKIGYGKNNKKMELSTIMVKDSSYNTTKLKKRLIEEGIKEHRCEKCNNTDWFGDLIPIELHHINGNCRDNRLDNLQILCPNCHTFTDNYGSKNMNNVKRKEPLKKILKPNEYGDKYELINWFNECDSFLCVSLLKNIPIRTLRSWIIKEDITEVISEIINKNKKSENELDQLINSLINGKSFTRAGKILNISDNGVKKRCKKYNLPTNKKDLMIYIKKGE